LADKKDSDDPLKGDDTLEVDAILDDELDADVDGEVEDLLETVSDETEDLADTVEDDVSEVAEDEIEDAIEIVDDASETIEGAVEDIESEPLEKILDEMDTTPEPTPIAPAPKAKSGFGGVFFGGLIAAGLGAAAMYYADTQGWLGGHGSEEFQAALDAQSAEIAALKAELETAVATSTETDTAQSSAIEALQSAGVDLSPLETGVAALVATDGETKTTLDALSASLTETRERLGSLEVQPIPKAELPKEVVNAYEKQLADILATIEGRFEEMQTVQGKVVGKIEADVTAKLEKLEAAQAVASETEEAALKAANLSAARAAATEITAALESGAGFGDALAVLQEKAGIAAPDGLSAVSDGVTTLAVLSEEYPAAARAALDAVPRDAGEDGSVNPLTSVILSQLGARSLEPREGGTADAVLSRAEAALKSGDLETVLAELAGLPEGAEAPFTDWIAQATALNDAKAAAAEVSAQLDNQ